MESHEVNQELKNKTEKKQRFLFMCVHGEHKHRAWKKERSVRYPCAQNRFPSQSDPSSHFFCSPLASLTSFSRGEGAGMPLELPL